MISLPGLGLMTPACPGGRRASYGEFSLFSGRSGSRSCDMANKVAPACVDTPVLA